jgi:type II secretory pathway component PulF
VGQFSYRAVDRAGAPVSGMIEAADRRSAVTAVTQRGHFVTELLERTPGRAATPEGVAALDFSRLPLIGGGRVSSKDVLAMTTQLSTAVRAGLPLLNCLDLIRKQQRKPGMRRMFEHLTKAVSSGKSLSEALAEHKRVFGPLYLSMIRVGETGGILEQTSTQLAAILGREDRIKTNMKNAAAYPIFVLCIGLISAAIIITGILPKIMATIDVGDAALPLPTRILQTVSDSMRTLFTSVGGWIILVGLLIGFWAFRKWSKTAGRMTWDQFKLRIPVLGSVLRTIAVGRFARTLGALTKGGPGPGDRCRCREGPARGVAGRPAGAVGVFPPAARADRGGRRADGQARRIAPERGRDLRHGRRCRHQPVHGDFPRLPDPAAGGDHWFYHRRCAAAHRDDVRGRGDTLVSPEEERAEAEER